MAAVARKDRCVEALLQMQPVAHADALREGDELGAARQEHVLSVVDLFALDLERGGAAAEDPAALE